MLSFFCGGDRASGQRATSYRATICGALALRTSAAHGDPTRGHVTRLTLRISRAQLRPSPNRQSGLGTIVVVSGRRKAAGLTPPTPFPHAHRYIGPDRICSCQVGHQRKHLGLVCSAPFVDMTGSSSSSAIRKPGVGRRHHRNSARSWKRRRRLEARCRAWSEPRWRPGPRWPRALQPTRCCG